MEFINTKIKAGAERPFCLLHISDTHLTFADGRDDERKQKLAENRKECFPEQCENLKAASCFAKENAIPIVHTGDLIDFVSVLNLEKAKDFIINNDCFVCAGNHEFSLYVGEAFEDEEYRNQSLKKVQMSFSNDIRFAVREINGVNLVAVDNSYYLIDENQLEKLKNTVSLGKPIILLLHTPLYSKQLFDLQMSDDSSAALMGVPEELMGSYSQHRYRQQKADETTKKAFEYIKGEKLIKAILAGHLHYNYEDDVTGTLRQYITGLNTGRIVEIL